MSTSTLTASPGHTAPPSNTRFLRPIAQIAALAATFLACKAIFSFTMFAGQISVVGMVIVATLMLRQDGHTWSDMGLRWAKSPKDVLKGAGIVVATLVLSTVSALAVQTFIIPLLGIPLEGRSPDISSLAIYALMIATVWTSNAFGEEMINRGFLMSRFSTIFGGTRTAWVLAAFAQAILFGLCHYGYGPAGIIATGVVGLVYGLVYLVAGRNLWPLIIAHGIHNTFFMTLMFMGQNGAVS